MSALAIYQQLSVARRIKCLPEKPVFVLMDYFGIARDPGQIASAPVKLHARQRYALLAINVV
jgi:hypothetical protein